MLNLDPTLLLVLTACLYILVFGGLSLLRREGLSFQFALEAIVVSVVLIGGAWLLNLRLSPVLLLIILYLVTMRSRLIVDLANLFARRTRYETAWRLYRLALGCWPDATARGIVLANQGAALLHAGQVQAAIEMLVRVLGPEHRTRLGIRYEAACCFNLGLAYEQKGDDAQAVRLYNEAIDLLPASVYAQAANARLKRRKEHDSSK